MDRRQAEELAAKYMVENVYKQPPERILEHSRAALEHVVAAQMLLGYAGVLFLGPRDELDEPKTALECRHDE